MEHKKKKKHDCASKVKSEQYGIGHCIPEQHTMLEDGTVTHYDVMFDHGIVQDVPVTELEILQESMHEHYDNEEKNAQIDEEEYVEHMCAKHVLHPVLGEGQVIEGEHAYPDEDGNIAWYKVQFEDTIQLIRTEDLKIMHESHHGHKMKKKKKMDEETVISENPIENLLDSIINGNNTQAKNDFEEAIGMKVTTALDSVKRELSKNVFNTEGAFKSMVTDKMTSGKGMSYDKALKAAEKDVKQGKNLPTTKLKK